MSHGYSGSGLPREIEGLLGILLLLGYVCVVGWFIYKLYHVFADHEPEPAQQYYMSPDFKQWDPVEPPRPR